jgi:hypothetical protein
MQVEAALPVVARPLPLLAVAPAEVAAEAASHNTRAHSPHKIF